MPDRSKLSYVRNTIRNERFEYAFVNYSHFEEIKDEKFHELREAYLKSQKALADYIDYDENDDAWEDDE